MAFSIGAPVRLVVRAATHVNPKATKHHTKSRPKKVRAEYPATSSLSHWDSILSKETALNPETDARRESARGIRGRDPDLRLPRANHSPTSYRGVPRRVPALRTAR
jgi:hypothetical protein